MLTNTISDFVPATTAATALSIDLPIHTTQQHTTQHQSQKPLAFLPDKDYITPLPTSAQEIAEILRNRNAVFIKNGSVVAPRENYLKELTPTDFAAELCSHIIPMQKRTVKNGIESNSALPTENQAKLLLSRLSGAESNLINKIDIASARPVLSPTGASLGSGYHKINNNGIYVCSGAVEHVSVDTAVADIKDLLKDFKFLTENDRSRFIAQILTPAYRTSGMCHEPLPMCVAEADQPGAGKSFGQQLIAAIYGETMRIVNIEKKGLGSLGEVLGSAICDGISFIQIDNCTEDVQSDFLASFLTGDEISVRTAYSRATGIKPQQISLFLTTNGAKISKDLIDRSCVARLRKQPENYIHDQNLLQKVRADQPHFLGCIHAIFREYIALGSKVSDIKDANHRMKKWAGVMDWILVNMFFEAPLLNGHGAIQRRCGSAGAAFIRALAQAAGGSFDKLTPLHLYHIAQAENLSCSGIQFSTLNEMSGSRKIGWIFMQLLGKVEEDKDVEITLDDIILTRHRSRGKNCYSAKLS